jgi:hypothetical protein
MRQIEAAVRDGALRWMNRDSNRWDWRPPRLHDVFVFLLCGYCPTPMLGHM